jgi:hypothetical protein
MQLAAELVAHHVPPHWLAYVAVRNVDASAAQATALGGAIAMPAMDIPDVGRVAVVRDPQGATIGIYTPSGESPVPADPPRHGDFSWHELTTTDSKAAWDFYATLFAWEKTSDFDMGPMGTYQMFGQNGKVFGGMFTKSADMPMPPNWLYYVGVPDVKQGADAVTRLGGKVLNGPMEVPGGDWIVQCMDPQGAMFALHSVKRA